MSRQTLIMAGPSPAGHTGIYVAPEDTAAVLSAGRSQAR
jgi:hypothetical protein